MFGNCNFIAPEFADSQLVNLFVAALESASGLSRP